MKTLSELALVTLHNNHYNYRMHISQHSRYNITLYSSSKVFT